MTKTNSKSETASGQGGLEQGAGQGRAEGSAQSRAEQAKNFALLIFSSKMYLTKDFPENYMHNKNS